MLSIFAYTVASVFDGHFYIGLAVGALVGVAGFRAIANKIGAVAAARGLKL